MYLDWGEFGQVGGQEVDQDVFTWGLHAVNIFGQLLSDLKTALMAMQCMLKTFLGQFCRIFKWHRWQSHLMSKIIFVGFKNAMHCNACNKHLGSIIPD